MYHDFSKRASPEDVADPALLFLVLLRRLCHDLLGDEREHLVVVELIYPNRIGDYAFSRLIGGFFGQVENGGCRRAGGDDLPGAEVVREREKA